MPRPYPGREHRLLGRQPAVDSGQREGLTGTERERRSMKAAPLVRAIASLMRARLSAPSVGKGSKTQKDATNAGTRRVDCRLRVQSRGWSIGDSNPGPLACQARAGTLRASSNGRFEIRELSVACRWCPCCVAVIE